jgi:hypothetical protein
LGHVFPGGLFVIRVDAALCLFAFTAKNQTQLKEKRQCAAEGLDKKHDRKTRRRDGERREQKGDGRRSWWNFANWGQKHN